MYKTWKGLEIQNLQSVQPTVTVSHLGYYGKLITGAWFQQQ